MTEKEWTCGVCGEPAVNARWEIEEGEAVKDAEGKLWATYNHTGRFWQGCAKHPSWRQEERAVFGIMSDWGDPSDWTLQT